MPGVLPLPFAADYVQLRSIIVDIAYGRPAKHVAKSTDVDEMAVISNLPFLKAMGMVTAGTSRQKIRLSRAGIEYANAVAASDEQAEKELIAACAAKALKPAIRFC